MVSNTFFLNYPEPWGNDPIFDYRYFFSTGLVQPPPIDNRSRGVHLGVHFQPQLPHIQPLRTFAAAQGPSVLVATYESSDVALWDLCPGQALFIQLLETTKNHQVVFVFGCVFFCGVLFCDLSLAGLLVVGLFVVFCCFLCNFRLGKRSWSSQVCVMARVCGKTMNMN